MILKRMKISPRLLLPLSFIRSLPLDELNYLLTNQPLPPMHPAAAGPAHQW
jgi:hypothetical protein